MRYGLLRNDGPAPRSSGHEGYLAGLHSSWNWQQPLKDLTPTERSLAIVGAVNLVYVFLQLGAASATGSLAMLSDAFHNLSDVGAAVIAFQAERFRKKLAPDGMPFGYLRVQVLGALINAVCLVSLAGYLILAATPALFAAAEAEAAFQPTPLYLAVASLGVVLNLGSAGLLICGGKDEHGNPIHVHAHVGCECGSLHNSSFPASPSSMEEAPSLSGKDSTSDASTPRPTGGNNGARISAAVAAATAAPCQDACCAPAAPLDAAALEVPFAFAAKRPRRGRLSTTILAASTALSPALATHGALELPTTVPVLHGDKAVQQKAGVAEGTITEQIDIEAQNKESTSLASVKKNQTLPVLAPRAVESLPTQSPPTSPRTPVVFPLKVLGPRVVQSCLSCGELVWKRKPIDENVLAVAVHSAGDAASSLAVLIAGLLVLLVEEDSSNDDRNSGESSSSSDISGNSTSTKWTAFLDPLVTIVLAVAMAHAMRGVLARSIAILLETSPLSAQELAKLTSILNQDPLMRAARLEVSSADRNPASEAQSAAASVAASENRNGSTDRETFNGSDAWPQAAMVVTALDFTESNRRATVRLRRRRRTDVTATPLAAVDNSAPSLDASKQASKNGLEPGTRAALLSRVKRLLEEHGGVRWTTVEIDDSS